MGKKNQKISRKLRNKRLEIAKKERKSRRNQRLKIVTPETNTVFFPLFLKKNALPVSVLMIGCFIFYSSTISNFHFNLNIDFLRYLQSAYAAESKTNDSKKLESNLKKNSEINLSIRAGDKNQKSTPLEHKLTSQEKYLSVAEDAPPIFSAEELADLSFDDSLFSFNIVKPAPVKKAETQINPKSPEIKKTKVSVVSTAVKKEKIAAPIKYLDKDPFENIEDLKIAILKLVKNTPMEAMVDDIIKRDRAVAAFLLGIGMKESKYGIYSPKKEGKECFNYWGYRGKENKTKSGYSCFDNPAHAVQVVGDRIEALVKGGRNTPAQMIIWKCGSTCAGHSEESVDKWIADVSINYYRLNPSVLLSRK